MKNELWSEEDKAYLAAFYEHDGSRKMAALFGKDERIICAYVWKLRHKNKWEYYKRKWFEQDINKGGE